MSLHYKVIVILLLLNSSCIDAESQNIYFDKAAEIDVSTLISQGFCENCIAPLSMSGNWNEQLFFLFKGMIVF